MQLDNDLMDLWLKAGLVDGFDKETARRLIEEMQEARDQADSGLDVEDLAGDVGTVLGWVESARRDLKDDCLSDDDLADIESRLRDVHQELERAHEVA